MRKPSQPAHCWLNKRKTFPKVSFFSKTTHYKLKFRIETHNICIHTYIMYIYRFYLYRLFSTSIFTLKVK